MQIAAGYPPEYVARQLGHANSAITQRLYSHEFDRRRDGERRREEYRARYRGILAGNTAVTPAGKQGETAALPTPRKSLI